MDHDMVSLARSLRLGAPVREVWAVAGDFHGLHRWHPGVARSTRHGVGNEEFRALDLVGGGHVVEHLERRTEHSYHYAMLRGPLPVAHYHGLLEANSEDGGTRLTWSCYFEPTARDAEAVIARFYETGLGALEERFATV